jgi:LysR family transcriptional regulator, benzoate and cis,cis-muconate-responsive activator of ben and cat genes
MELRHLRYFLAVAETLHFSRAAGQLHLTQPALSRQIRDLENELGAALFRRHGTETRLTAAGERFLLRTREILALSEKAVREVKEAPPLVRLGHYGTLWVDYYAPAVRAFAKRFPKISVQAVEQTPIELITALRRGEVDIALLGPTEKLLGQEFSVRRLGCVSALVAMNAAHPLAKRRRLSLLDLRDAGWIVWDEKSFPGREFPLRKATEDAGYEPKIAGRADSVASLFVRLATDVNAMGYVLPMSKKLPHTGVVFCALKPPGIAFEMDVAWDRRSDTAGTLSALAELLAITPPAK